MLVIEAAILRTVLYADVFNFPLTHDELHRYLISNNCINEQDIQTALTTSTLLAQHLYHDHTYICLKTRQDIISIRTKREEISKKLLNSATQYGKLLSHIPFVEMVALTGALAMRNPASQDDDFDYLLITQPKRVWLARFFAVILVRIVRLFGREICPNYVLASDQLAQTKQDLYMAHEVTQMQPIYGESIYHNMLTNNLWVQRYLPNATAYIVPPETPRRFRKLLEWCLSGWLGNKLEVWEYQRKLNKFSPKLAQKQSSAEINQSSVKGHFDDHGLPVMGRYEQLLEEYGLLDRQQMRILVTGALGWTAKAIVEALQSHQHTVSGLDLKTIDAHTQPTSFEAMHYASIEDYDAVYSAVQNQDMIVHLAVATNGGYETPEKPFNVTVRGTANIFSAAIEHGIKRVILISSAPFHVDHPQRIHAIKDRLQGAGGDFMYDLTKCLQEDIGEYYAKTGQITVITLRAGHIVDGHLDIDPKGRDLATIDYGRGSWVCRYDLARAVVRAIDYPCERYTAFHIIGSQEAMKQFDMERTENDFKFLAETRFENYPLTKKE